MKLSPEEKLQLKFQKALEYQRNFRERQIAKNKEKIREGVYPRKKINKFSEKMKLMHEKDAKFYEEIWNERPHYCVNCNIFLGNLFKDDNEHLVDIFRYAHIIPKSTYPYLRHYKDNLMLLCLKCHTKLDNSPKEIVEKMPCYDFNKIEQLKILHKKLEKNNDETYK